MIGGSVKEKLAFASVLIITTSGLVAHQLTRGPPTLKIFHAGSLAQPFEEIEKQFEDRYDFDVQREAFGSVLAVKQVTEFHRAGDIVASSDCSLIPDLMIPEHADWYIIFARNEMVLAHTAESKYADEIDENNWYELLGRSGVRFGFSNPNLDPCGYRALMVIQLAEQHYDNPTIFEELISANTNITASYENGAHSVEVPRTGELGPNTEKVEIAPKSVELLAKLEAGSIDYAFEYRSVAVQGGFEYVELPAEIDLGSVGCENIYRRVRVLVGGKTHLAKPIAYGITIPNDSKCLNGAIDFVKFLVSEEGRRVLERSGLPPIFPAVASNIDRLPGELRPFVIS